MDRDFLREQGIADDKIEAIMTKYGQSVNGLKNEVADLKTDVTKYKNQVSEKEKDLGDLETLKATNQTLQNELDTTKEKLGEVTKEGKINHAIDIAIIRAKPKSEDLAKKLIDREKVEVEFDENGDVIEVKGVDEQVEEIKTQYPYVFNDDSSGEGSNHEGDQGSQGDQGDQGDGSGSSGSSGYDPGGTQGNHGKKAKEGELGLSFAKKLYPTNEEGEK